jgi:hypothetical protein
LHYVIIYKKNPNTTIVSNLIVHPTKRNLNCSNELLQVAIKEVKVNDYANIIYTLILSPGLLSLILSWKNLLFLL